MVLMIALLSLLLGFAGWLWIVIMAFSEGETLWGVGSLIIPIVALIYGIINFSEAKVPVILLVSGFALRLLAIGITMVAGSGNM